MRKPTAEENELRTEENAGVKFDAEKPDFTLLPFDALTEVVKVLDFGARKYSRDNWRRVPNAERRYMAAALRHLIAHEQGETNDTESGLSHLAHAACCVLFLLSFKIDAENETR